MTRSRDISALLGSTGTITASVLDASVSEALGGGTDEYANPAALPATADVGDQAFVSSTNRLYIWTGAGWYNIALINQTPTWDSGGQPAGSYVLAIDGSPTTITLLATDPDGLTISYTATADSAFDAIATVSDSDNVFTITPKFTIDDDSAADGSGSITFRATDGVNLATALSSFSISFIIGVENSKYTAALITSVGSNGGTNSTVTDSSTNNHTLTVNGSASSQTFSPYRSGGYSYYFDGTGDYLTIDSTSAFGFGTSTDFTLEAWFYPTTTTGDRALFDFRPSSSANATFFIDTSTGKLAIWNGTFYGGTGTIVSANEWHHIALVRSGSTTTAYLDGSVDFTTTASLDFSTAKPLGIGGAYFSPGSYFTGFISDLRILKGTALYTAAFTPPTERLEAITNTSLLTCHLPYVKDGSTNDHSITVNGNVSAKPFGPYDYLEYDSATHGGCLEVGDSASDVVTLSPGSSTTFGTDDFTVELWVYRRSIPSDSFVDCIISNRTSAGNNPGGTIALVIENDGDDQFGFQWNVSGTLNKIYGGKCELNNWYHLAAVRNGSSLTLYVNGKSVVSTATTDSIGGVIQDLTIGGMKNGDLRAPCYVSDIRIVKGTAVYTADFTPPTEPLTAISGTELLVSGTDASIIDKSQSTKLTLAGNTQSSTTVTKYGSSSMYFDGTGDYIRADAALEGITSSTPFTIEAWVYPTSSLGGTSTDSMDFIGINTLASGSNTLTIGNRIVRKNGTTYDPTDLSLNQWHHIAYVYDGSNSKYYINGSLNITISGTVDNLEDCSLLIGAEADAANAGSLGNYFSGYLEDVRITKGLARYTANFTPATASLEG